MINYSKTEQKLIDLLKLARNKDGVGIAGLVKQFYSGKMANNEPYYSEIKIGNAMRSIAKKMKINKEKFLIEREGKRHIVFRYRKNTVLWRKRHKPRRKNAATISGSPACG